jgi:hypothetical protein
MIELGIVSKHSLYNLYLLKTDAQAISLLPVDRMNIAYAVLADIEVSEAKIDSTVKTIINRTHEQDF